MKNILSKIFLGSLLLFAPVFLQAQNTPRYVVDAKHVDVYFRTVEEILETFGTPITAEEIIIRGESSLLYVYLSSDRSETIWLIFVPFDSFFPELDFIENLRGKLVIGNIAYFPLIGNKDISKIKSR